MRAMRTERPRRAGKAAGPGPGPSRLHFRAQRAWKKAWVRQCVLVVLPLVLAVGICLRLAADPAVHAQLAEIRAQAIQQLSARPEFSVRELRVTGASEDLERAVHEVVQLTPGMSSLTLKVAELKPGIEALGAVKTAHVTLGSDSVLRVHITERVPAVLWRDSDDKLWLMDREGALIERAVTRLGYPELPVVLGEGAADAVAEGLALLAGAAEIRPRLRALVRVGERRWNLALDRDLTIMLPEEAPAAALSRVIAWHYGEEVLDRDLAVIDMRIAARPTLRMTPEALDIYRLRQAAEDAGEET